MEIRKLPKYEECLISFENKCDSNIIGHSEVKKFNTMINQYRKKVEKEAGVKVVKKGKEKSKKSENRKNEPKKKSSSKTSKSEKGKSSQEADFIQLLPVWVVKRIFSYLDDKTLAQIKKVNEYWSYIVENLKSDNKARKSLDNKLDKINVTSNIFSVNTKLQHLLL